MQNAYPAMAREPSPPSVEETVATSASDFLELAKRRALTIGATAAVMTMLAVAFLVHQTPLYRATSELLVDPQALQVVGRDIVRSDTAASIDFANIDSQALVIVSTSVLNQLIDELDLENDPALRAQPGLLSRIMGGETPAASRAATIDALRKAVVARRVDNSLVFEITASHPDAERSAAIANSLAAIYLRQGSDGRGAAVKRAGDSLLGQLASLRGQLNDAESAVATFRGANNLISTGEAGLIVDQQLRDLYGRITTAESDVARLAARRDQLSKLGPDALLSDRITEALNAPSVTALRGQYAAMSQEAARLAETLLPRHPRLVEARGELAAARKSLADELDRIRASIVEDYDQARGALAKLKERAAALTQNQVSSSQSEIRLRQLESEAEAIRAVYNASLGRAKELEQQEKIQTSNSRLISSASVPLKATKAPAAIVLPAAALFGACLGFALAFLFDLLRGAAPNARAAGEMFGVDAVATLRRRGPGATLDATDHAALIGVARRLQALAGVRSPAIVVVAAAPELDATTRREVIAGVGRALASVGEGVWICAQNDRDEPMHMERIRSIHTGGEAQAPTGGPLVEATKRARSVRVMEALHGRSATRGEASEFLVISDDDPSGLTASAAVADAVVLVFAPGRTRRRALRQLAAMLDPTSERTAAVIAVEPARGGGISSPRRAASKMSEPEPSTPKGATSGLAAAKWSMPKFSRPRFRKAAA